MLFQKKQTGYQSYRTPSNLNKSKVKILIVVISLTVLIAILGILISPKKDGSSTNTTNELEDYSELSFSIFKPKGYSSSKTGQATVFKLSEDKNEDPEYFSVEKYAKTSNNITPEVLKSSSIRDSNGVEIKNAKSELKEVNNADTLSITIPQDKDITNRKVYIFGNVNIWLIYFHTKDGSALQKNEQPIIESFTLKRSDGELGT